MYLDRGEIDHRLSLENEREKEREQRARREFPRAHEIGVHLPPVSSDRVR